MSSTRKKLTINALSALIQVVFTALLYFFLYKYLLGRLGIQQLGIWSLILSFSSIANLANFGITSGLVKFVADYLAEKQENKIGKLILTAIISMAILFSVFSVLILYGAKYFLHYVIDAQFLSIAFSILPYSLGSLCLNAVSGVFTSVLEGFQKNYLRNFIYIFSGIIMIIATVLLTPIFHLQGVAMAQLIQCIFIFIAALVLMYRMSPFNKFTQWKWSTKTFKELFNYGYKFQVVSICQMLYEPTTKLLLSKFGGLALLGHYEMATRAVNQFRALLVNANQVVIPVIAEKAKTSSFAHRQDFFRTMNRILLLFTLPLSTILIVITPFISIIWLGSIDMDFTFAMYVLIISVIINIMCGPSYFSCMGEGRLSILVIVHVGMAIANLVFGYLLGISLGGYGIILSWGLSLSIGSLFLIYAYSAKISVRVLQIFSSKDYLLLIASLLIIISIIISFTLNTLAINNYFKTGIALGATILIYFAILRKNDIITSNINRILSLKKKSANQS